MNSRAMSRAADELLDDLVAAGLEVAHALAADDDEVRIVRFLDEGLCRLAGIRRIRTCQSLVRGDQEDELPAILVLLEQWVRKVHACILGDGVDDLADLLCIGTVHGCSLFGMAQTARSDHVHGTRDLLGTLYALDAMANIL